MLLLINNLALNLEIIRNHLPGILSLISSLEYDKPINRIWTISKQPSTINSWLGGC